MNNYPLLNKIPIDRRMTVINDLARYQLKKHGCDLEVCNAIKNGRWPVQPDITIDAPDYQEKHLEDVNAEIASNSDINWRLK